jgi:tRNA threonylcarbamoyladenosine biosynthesis protein TsaB
MVGDGTWGDAPVLALDAATPSASVAVLRAGIVVAERAATMRPGGDDALMPAVDAALRAAGVVPRDLAAVVCGAGPGGFTSLRIGAALAKGIVHAAGCALVAVPSLALAAAARATTRAAAARPGPEEWLVTLDALRGERYVAAVDTVVVNDRVRVTAYRYLGVRAAGAAAAEVAHATGRREHVDASTTPPVASAVRAFVLARDASPVATPGPDGALTLAPVDLDTWEPHYGRQAEAQVRWEATHGRALETALAPTPADHA